MRTIGVAKLDIFNPMMEEYFLNKVASLTPAEIEKIPQDIRFKLFKAGAMKSSHDLRFNEKAHLLTTTFNQNMIIVFEDDINGIGPNEFKNAVRAQKAKITNGELLEDKAMKSIFILGNKELMAPLMYLNHVFCSDIYSLISTPVVREKTGKEKKYLKFAEAYKGLTEVFTHYEATKKLIPQMFDGIDIPSWYALLFFATRERKGSEFYDGMFKYAYLSSRKKLHVSLKKLYDTGHLTRRGKRNDLRYSITAKGTDLLNQIIDKVILSYKKSTLV